MSYDYTMSILPQKFLDRGMIFLVCGSIVMFDRLKWGILLKVLPFTGLFTIAKFGIHQMSWEAWTFDSLTGALFSAAIFVIALVLSK